MDQVISENYTFQPMNFRSVISFFIVILFSQIDSQAQSDSLMIFKEPTLPSFPGGDKDLMNYVYARMPEGDFGDGVVHVNFQVDSTGKVVNPTIARSFNNDLNEQILLVFEDFPLFEMNGSLPVKFNVPILFGESRTKHTSYYDVVPKYVGGEEVMIDTIVSNLKLSGDKSVEHCVPHTMFVEFIVTKKGQVADFKMKKSSTCAALDQAAIDACYKLKHWIPATDLNGKFVDSNMMIPISVHLK